MDTEALLLPEPFSEKNIDGSPITKASEGRALFKSSAKPERRTGERWSGHDRRASAENYAKKPQPVESYDYDIPNGSAASEHGSSDGYDTAYAPVGTHEKQDIEISYKAPEYDEPVSPKPAYDPERFDPPVDEKPGMIPNPMKMPPVKKKSSLEYDVDDSDYGGYGEASEVREEKAEPVREVTESTDDDYGYSFDPDSSSGGDDYGYYDDEPVSSTERTDLPDDNDTNDDGYGYGFSSGDDADDGDVSRGSDSSDDGDGYDADYGSGGGYDDDYGSDFDSGSDLADDYY